MKKWIIIVLLLATGSAVAYKWPNIREKYFPPANISTTKTALVESKDIQFSINAAGDIGPADQVSVRPEINGKIEILRVDIGDKATKGDLLFKLDDKDLQTERASRITEIDGAKLELDRARRNYQRAEQLYGEKLISQELFEDTKTNFELAKNALDRAQRALEQVEERLTKTKIAAPFDCTILTRPVSVGQAVSGSGGYNSGTEVLTIANLNEMIINAHINQADVTRLKVDQEVDIEVEAIPGLKLNGVIERLAPQATVRNGIKGFATRILLKHVDDRVRPGMTANVSIPIASASNVLAVPLAAVYTEAGDRYVYVKKGIGFERVSIQVGIADFFFVEVQQGLTAGQEVALEQPPGIEPNKKDEGPVVTGARNRQASTGGSNAVAPSKSLSTTNRVEARTLASTSSTNLNSLPRRAQ